MTKTSLLPPSGTRDFLPQEAAHRLKIFRTIQNVFERHGFAPFDTPAFERIETLMGKYGEEGEKLIFKILKRGEKAGTGEADYALRYDLTVPTMRAYAGNKHHLPPLFKRYQMAPVWRADRPGQGRFREFYQCDVDIFGSKNILADAEIIATLGTALREVGLADFTVNLNSRKLLKAMMPAYAIAPQHAQKLLITLDKMDKIGVEGVEQEFAKIEGLEAKELLADIHSGEYKDRFLDRVTQFEGGQQGHSETRQIMDCLSTLAPQMKVVFDPLMVRGLDYYTGSIFEITSRNFKGSIAAGGRYDDLGKSLAGTDVSVCGGSLGIERILMLLEEQKADSTHGPLIYVTSWDKTTLYDALVFVTALREQGISAEIDMTGDRLGGQLKMADKRDCTYALIQGPEEKAAGQVVLKNLKEGTQEVMKFEDIQLSSLRRQG